MTTLMPADRHSRTAAGTLGAQRIGEADQSQELEVKSRCDLGQGGPAWRGAGDAQHAQALRAIASIDRVSAARSAVLEPAKARDCLGRALGGDDESCRSSAGCQTWVTARRSGRRP